MKNQNSILRGIIKRMTALLIVLFILFPMLPNIDFGDSPLTLKASAATVASGNGTWISGKLTYTWEATSNGTTSNGATGTVSVSGNTLTVTATNSKEVSGCSTTAAEATTTTVTVTNASSYPLKINTLTTGGSASVTGVSQGDTIASGATFKVTVTAPAVSSSTKVSGTVAIAVEEQTNVTITLEPSPYVSYTVNGMTVAQNGSSQSFTTNAGTTISLPSITAPSGYTFKGWRVGSGMTTASSFTANASFTVFPVIVSSSVDTTAANFKVGSTTYTFWEDAVTAAVSGDGKMFVNLEEVTLPANVLDNLLPASGGSYVKPVTGGGIEYILPGGVTLVLPYSTSTTVHTTTPAYGYKQRVAPSPFRTMTVPNGAKITVNGSVSVDSYVCAYGQSNQGNGTPSGPHGKIVMKSGSEMTLNSGANLYCYGYINGDGNIYVKSGAKVYELFQFCDWRGGNGTSDINGNSQRVFPMSQYYVQNVEAPMRIYKGATEYVWSVVNMSSSAYPTNSIEFIGTNGMFKLTGGSSDYVMKRYHANIDQLEITAHGDMSLNKLSVSVSGLPLIGSITMNSNEYVLPLNNMNIVVETGTTSIANSQTYGVAFLPSSKLTVNEGATFSANAPVYLYDSDDWGGYCGASNLKLVVSGYSTANGTTTIRTADNLKDAEIDVNGTVNVTNKLYTTEHGACITSSAGTGVIEFTTACATGTATTYQATQSGSSISAYVPITVNNAWLQNGDGSYSQTVSTGTSTWRYDKPGEHWYRYLVDFNYNNTLIARDYYCENNDTVTYDASWLTDLGATASNGTAAVSGTDVNVTNVTANSTVTLTGTPAEYIPTFVLNEKQYSIYQLYTGGTLSETTTIGGNTYYIVDQASSALAVGTAYAAPTEASMGVTAANHNSITWNMSGLSATSGNPYLGTVPAGETAQGPTYIYGFYTGVVAHNSWNDQYYDTLIGAFAVLPQDVSATITLLADCGTFEDESGTVAYTAYPANTITLDLNGHKAVGRIVNSGNFTLELNGGTLDYHTGATAAAAAYAGMATVINSGTLTVQDSVGGGKVTSDAISNSSTVASYSAVVYNKTGASFTMTGGTLEYAMASVNNYAAALLNYGTASISDSTLTTSRGYGIYNTSSGTVSLLQDSTVSVTHASGANAVYNTAGTITRISGSTLNTKNTTVLYNYNGGTITTIQNTSITVSAPTTKNVYAVWNYGGTITTMSGCTITGNSGINNRNQRTSAAITAGYALAYQGKIGTISNTTVDVGQYAIYNGGTINTLTGSHFYAHPASAQVNWPSGTAALNGNTSPYTIVNSNLWWYDSAVWKRTDTSVSNNGTTMLQRRISEYKTDDAYMPTIGTITDCEIRAQNTSTSNSYGYYALQNQGVINTINGNTQIVSEKHPDNAKTVYGYYALYNTGGGKIGTIASTVTISAYNYAVANLGARYSQTDVTYSTTYLESGALKSGGLATDYDYTYADVSTIGSTAATVTATSQYAILNYSKIGEITGTISGNYNVIVNAGAAGTTTGIEGTTANVRAIEHRYFENNDSSTTANEYRRYFEYTRNTTDGCYIGSINATITATGAGYQAVTNQGYIGTLAGTVTTPTGKATSSSTYYPLIYNGNQRQATLKQTEDYYVETNGYGATKYLREYTYEVPTIDTISCTATNPQDYTLQNCGQINNLTGSLSGKTITVANEAGGPFLTRKTITFYSSATRLAATKASTEVNYEYTKQPAEITNINGATITTTGTTLALRNYGYVGEIKDSTITSTTTNTIQNGAATTNSTVTSYTSNRLDVLTGCTPSADACALAYDQTQTINEVAVRAPALINKIGSGNYISGTYFALYNMGRINEIDSGSGDTTIIYGSSRQAIYNLQGCYSRVTNTDAVLTNATGTTTNNYTYEYAPAYIGTIKNVYILGKRQAILNGDGNATYCGVTPVTIGEIGAGVEARTTATATYSAVHNYSTYARIGEISGGVFMTGTGSGIYGLKNESTTYPILITGGDFRGGDGTRALAIMDPDNTAKYTYPAGKKLSTGTETATYHTLSNKVLTAKTNSYYYIANTYTVTFDAQGHGTAPADQTIESGQKATAPTAPTATGYRFDGWYKESGCTNAWNFSSDTVTANTTLYAKWTALYTVTFNANGHGDAPAALTNIVSGSKITAPTAPTATGWQFDGWYKEDACTNAWNFNSDTVTANTTLYAKWTQAAYTVTWKNYDGTTLRTDSFNHGTTPTYSGETPTKPSTDQFDYTFSGWTPEPASITGDIIYTASFTESLRYYTVTWKNDDGSEIDTTSVAFGTTPTHADPTKDATAQYTYAFSGWTPAVAPVSGDAEYTATFTGTVREYTVTVTDESGDTIEMPSGYSQAGNYQYGENLNVPSMLYADDDTKDTLTLVSDTTVDGNKEIKYVKTITHTLSTGGDILEKFIVKIPTSLQVSSVAVNDSAVTVTPATVNQDGSSWQQFDLSGVFDSPEMTQDMAITVTLSDRTVLNDSFCVQDYCHAIQRQESPAADLLLLTRTMLHYGRMAQIQFNKNTDKLAQNLKDDEKGINYIYGEVEGDKTADEVDTALNNATVVPDPVKGDYSAFGISYYGSAPVLDSEIALRHYFTVSDASAYDGVTVTLTDSDNQSYTTTYTTLEGKPTRTWEEYLYVQRAGNYVICNVMNIPASKLGESYTITFSKDGAVSQSFTYSVLNYAKKAVNNANNGENLKNVVRAMYCYYDAAKQYFDNRNAAVN